MCILFLITNQALPFGKYKLILASNRDEFYARPAVAAQRWKEHPDTIGGRDMEAGREGGTWLALSTNTQQKAIKLGALLNVSGEKPIPNARGRGPIITKYINSDLNNEQYSKELADIQDFNAYNFISVEIKESLTKILFTSNAPKSAIECSNAVSIGFGNSPFEQPLQKVVGGQKMFDEIVNNATLTNKEDLVDQLLGMLKCRDAFWPDEELLKRQPQWGQSLSHINVKMSGYGTRTHTIILIDDNNNIDFYEETMVTDSPDGEWRTTHLQSQL